MNTVVQYLHDVALLECQLYTQNRIISSLSSKVSKLGIAKRYKKPTHSALKIKDLFYVDWRYFGENGLLVIFGAAATCLAWIIEMFNFGTYLDTFCETFHLGTNSGILSIIVAFLFCFCIIPLGKSCLKFFLPCVIVSNYLDHVRCTKIYHKDMEEYNEATQKDALRVQKELSLKRVFQTQLQDVQQRKRATESALTSLYSIGIIHPKYQHNIVAVSSFYDYFDTGRCLSFTGPSGAYDTFENDLHFHRLETKLDVIITKLDEIIDNQRMLSELMRDANNTLYRIEQSNKKMMGSMSRIESNSEITAYNSRCTMESNKVMEHIAVYNALRVKTSG